MALKKGRMHQSELALGRFHDYNQDLKHGEKSRLPKMSLLESIQGNMDTLDMLSMMTKEDKEALNNALGSEEGIIDLSKLSKKGAEIAKDAKLTIEGGFKKILEKVLIFLSPAIAAVISTFIVYRLVICCLTRRNKEPGSHRNESINTSNNLPPVYEQQQPEIMTVPTSLEINPLLSTPYPSIRRKEIRTVQRGDVTHELHIYTDNDEEGEGVNETAL